jgi:hypothetical protein
VSEITFEFATQDDCLDRMVPSELRQLVAERDQLRQQLASAHESIEARNKELMKMVQEAEKAQPEAGGAVAVLYENGDVVTRKQIDDDKVFAVCCKVQQPLYTHTAPVVPEGLLNLLNAVGHVGVDFGYGPYELCAEEIEKARDLYAQLSAAQEKVE